MLDSRANEHEPRDRRVACQGEDDRALPRPRLHGPGLLRPRPRPAGEPRQGQARRGRRARLRARVRDRRRTASKQVGGDRARPPAAPTRSTSRPTSTARARRSPGTSPRRSACRPSGPRRVTFSEITEPAIREAFAHPRGDRPQPRRRPAGAPDRRPAGRLHAQPAALAQGPRRPVRRPRPVGRGAPGRRPRARDPRVHGARVLDDRGAPRSPRAARRSPPSSSGSTAQKPDDRRRRDGRAATSRRSGRAGRSSTSVARQALEAEPGAAVHDLDPPAGGEPQARLQPEADDARRPAPVRGRRDARGPGRPDHLHAHRLGRPVGPGDGRGARGHRRAATAPRYTMPKGRPFKTKSQDAQEAHEAIRPTSFRATPTRSRGTLGRDEVRLYRLIWQRALASQMAAKELETTTVELDGRAVRPAGDRPRGPSSTASPRSTPRATTTPPRRPSGRLPALAEGDVTTVADVTPTQHFTEPPPRYTEATLIKALEEHGIGRPSTYAATISTIIDRGYVTVVERRLHPEPVGEVVTDLLVEHFGEFVDLDVHGPDGGGARRGRPRRAAWVPLLREFYDPLKELVDEKRAELRRRDFTTEPTDEVCSLGPPDGHPARPERPVPRLLALSRAQGVAAAARRGAGGRPGRCPGVGEACPECGRPTAGRSSPSAAGSGRSSAARATRTASTSSATARRRPSRCPFEVACPRCGEGHLDAAPRAADRRVFWGCSRYPKCDFTTSREPLGAAHDADGGPGRPEGRGRRRSASKCGAAIDLPAASIVARHGARRRPARPGGARPARPRRARRGRAAAVARAARGRRADAGDDERRAADAHGRPRAAEPSARPGRDRSGRPRSASSAGLAARDASAHTRALVRHRDRRLPRLARRARDRLAAAVADRAAGLPRRPVAGPRPDVGRPAARGDPLVLPLRGRATGSCAGDPWGAIATPRLPRRLPRVLEVGEVERLLDGDRRRGGRRGGRRRPAPRR